MTKKTCENWHSHWNRWRYYRSLSMSPSFWVVDVFGVLTCFDAMVCVVPVRLWARLCNANTFRDHIIVEVHIFAFSFCFLYVFLLLYMPTSTAFNKIGHHMVRGRCLKVNFIQFIKTVLTETLFSTSCQPIRVGILYWVLITLTHLSWDTCHARSRKSSYLCSSQRAKNNVCYTIRITWQTRAI